MIFVFEKLSHIVWVCFAQMGSLDGIGRRINVLAVDGVPRTLAGCPEGRDLPYPMYSQGRGKDQ